MKKTKDKSSESKDLVYTKDREFETEINKKTGFIDKIRNMSIGWKLAIVVILIATIGFTTFGVVNYLSIKKVTLKDTGDTYQELASIVSDSIDDWFNNKAEIMIMSVEAGIKSGGIDKDKAEDILEYLVRDYEDIHSVYFGIDSGLGIFSDRWIQDDDWLCYERDWYIEADKNKGEITYLQPYIDPSTGDLVITISKYLGEYYDNKIISALDMELTPILNIVEDIELPEGGSSFITNNNGEIISHTLDEYNSKGEVFLNLNSINEYTGLKENIENGIYVYDGKDINNNEIMTFSSPIGKTGFIFNVSLPIDVLMDNFHSELLKNIILLGVLILVFVVIMVFVANNMVNKPIGEIVEAAQLIAEGNLDIEFKDGPEDEIGLLRNNFMKIIDSIDLLVCNLCSLTDDHSQGITNSRMDINSFTGAYREVSIEINDSFDIYVNLVGELQEVMKEMGEGNFQFEIKEYPGDLKQTNESIMDLRNNLINVKDGINHFADNAAMGILDERADINNIKGEWRVIFEGLNNMIEAIAEPVEEAKLVLGEISGGNLEAQMVGVYDGDFAEIEDIVNNMSRTLRDYINNINMVLNRVANDDLTTGIERDYIGDFAEIKDSINMIINKFNDVLREMEQATEQINVGSAQISDSSMNLAEGANEQTAAVEHLNQLMGEITNQAINNRDIAENADSLTKESMEVVILGHEQMEDLLLSMKEIQEATENISGIINMIDDISFQVNLLALNASIEAARAGEHGAGFAVVAHEIKDLADASQKSVAQSSQLLDITREKVGDGSLIANNTSKHLEDAREKIMNVAEVVREVNANSIQQSIKVEEAALDIESIRNVILANSSTSEETAAAAEELSSQANVFAEYIDRFDLE